MSLPKKKFLTPRCFESKALHWIVDCPGNYSISETVQHATYISLGITSQENSNR